jgi:hypothetical protein
MVKRKIVYRFMTQWWSFELFPRRETHYQVRVLAQPFQYCVEVLDGCCSGRSGHMAGDTATNVPVGLYVE